jgi:hypothetical protein
MHRLVGIATAALAGYHVTNAGIPHAPIWALAAGGFAVLCLVVRRGGSSPIDTAI